MTTATIELEIEEIYAISCASGSFLSMGALQSAVDAGQLNELDGRLLDEVSDLFDRLDKLMGAKHSKLPGVRLAVLAEKKLVAAALAALEPTA